ncbi:MULTISPECIES: DUF1090 domain-containing protein [unclassified Brenneria]|uniref:DUF1090 domain-containing protein n=1 Tax=unclassified Brenneria TaxID=2634434 RepID=UPI0015576249|nr:DUF1090 domain-containing protein [Brenneria sp. hezel4-2-4]MEE3651253.1 DUF1090 domain-containing protein [Brenneria sp. HEZEL_4_2_4]NPD01209.1 DUF1090 domain-containing protein [Brenneria sp. hezel4-2-4]
MKIHHLIGAILLAFSGSSLAQTGNMQGGCLQKEQDIQSQIDHARQHGNQHRVQGLQRALAEVKANCTDAGLAAERQQKIAEKRAEVAERQRELNESQQRGDTQKILKHEKKLAEKQQELQALERK